MDMAAIATQIDAIDASSVATAVVGLSLLAVSVAIVLRMVRKA